MSASWDLSLSGRMHYGEVGAGHGYDHRCPERGAID